MKSFKDLVPGDKIRDRESGEILEIKNVETSVICTSGRFLGEPGNWEVVGDDWKPEEDCQCMACVDFFKEKERETLQFWGKCPCGHTGYAKTKGFEDLNETNPQPCSQCGCTYKNKPLESFEGIKVGDRLRCLGKIKLGNVCHSGVIEVEIGQSFTVSNNENGALFLRSDKSGIDGWFVHVPQNWVLKAPESPESSPNGLEYLKAHNHSEANTAHSQGSECQHGAMWVNPDGSRDCQDCGASVDNIPLSSWEGIKVGMRLRCIEANWGQMCGSEYTVKSIEPDGAGVWFEEGGGTYVYEAFTLIPDPEKRCATEVRVYDNGWERLVNSFQCDCGAQKVKDSTCATWCSSRG